MSVARRRWRRRREAPTFHEFASEWLADRARELRATTLATYEWELSHHLLPHFARVRVDAIGVEEVDRYRRRKVAEGRLGATSINKTIGRLGQILDVAQERGLIVQNPVRVNPRNRKVRGSRPSRPWLEPEQVLALLHAAAGLDRGDGRGLAIRRPLLATLAWAGLRVGEATALRWRDVSLADGAIRVDESKTAAGVRTVDVQPELHDELAAWRAVTPFGGPDDFVFPTRSGGPQNRHNVRQRVVLKSAAAANAHFVATGRPVLPEGLSPHALRRSFASWLIAEGEDVAYVMQQMGHEDPSMTLGVYARAVRSGRRSARSARRIEHLDRAPTATGDAGSLLAPSSGVAA
ncbi:MAG: tyrosine-type recombinase/integrase [Solirubrobacteraceae bacterium]